MNLTHHKSLLLFLVYYLLLVLYIKLFNHVNIEINTIVAFTNIQKYKGNCYFWTIVLGKIQCEKTDAADMRILLLCRFMNTTRVLEMDHPSEIFLGRSTLLSRQIFQLIQQPDDWPHNDFDCSLAVSKLTFGTASSSKHCVTLHGSASTFQCSVCPTERPQRTSFSPASALLASTSAYVLCASPLSLCVNSVCLFVSPGRLCAVSPTLSLPLYYVFSTSCRTAPHYNKSPGRFPQQTSP